MHGTYLTKLLSMLVYVSSHSEHNAYDHCFKSSFIYLLNSPFFYFFFLLFFYLLQDAFKRETSRTKAERLSRGKLLD